MLADATRKQGKGRIVPQVTVLCPAELRGWAMELFVQTRANGAVAYGFAILVCTWRQ